MAKQVQNKKNTAATTKKSSNGQASPKSANSRQTGIRRTTQKNNVQKEEAYSSKLEKLFVDMLKDMLWAENHLVTALQKMQQKATTTALQDAFEDHLFATKKHAARLEKVFGMMGKEAEEKKCDAMEGLTKEADAIINETEDGSMTRDAALIIAAQKVEHYEIATYGSLVQLARTMDREDVARLLEKTLWDEEDTDQLLTDIAESDVNPMADEEDAEGEDEDEDEEESGETMGNPRSYADSIGNA